MGLPRLRSREIQMLKERSYTKNRSVAQRLLKDAKDIDLGLESWASTIPEEFLFSSVPLQTGPLADETSLALYPHSMDIYCDHAMANIWNSWRTTRITVLRIISTCTDILNHSNPIISTDPSTLTPLDMIQSLVDDICATVPFHLGHHERTWDDGKAIADYPHPPGEAKWPDNFRATGAAGGFLMMQPLSFVAKLDCIPQSQRDWVREYLTTFLRDPTDMKNINLPPQLR